MRAKEEKIRKGRPSIRVNPHGRPRPFSLDRPDRSMTSGIHYIYATSASESAGRLTFSHAATAVKTSEVSSDFGGRRTLNQHFTDSASPIYAAAAEYWGNEGGRRSSGWDHTRFATFGGLRGMKTLLCRRGALRTFGALAAGGAVSAFAGWT